MYHNLACTSGAYRKPAVLDEGGSVDAYHCGYGLALVLTLAIPTSYQSRVGRHPRKPYPPWTWMASVKRRELEHGDLKPNPKLPTNLGGARRATARGESEAGASGWPTSASGIPVAQGARPLKLPPARDDKGSADEGDVHPAYAYMRHAREGGDGKSESGEGGVSIDTYAPASTSACKSSLRLRSPKSYSAPDDEGGDGEGDGEGGEGGVYLCPIHPCLDASTPRDGARHLEAKPPAPAPTLAEVVLGARRRGRRARVIKTEMGRVTLRIWDALEISTRPHPKLSTQMHLKLCFSPLISTYFGPAG
ncbi:hypothetical protein B0H13DRAFT_1914071 [Mycena leptocephala]|nr:hypothetical protein B0H13DRAFT_1914071 [Mycena leptocephala]